MLCLFVNKCQTDFKHWSGVSIVDIEQVSAEILLLHHIKTKYICFSPFLSIFFANSLVFYQYDYIYCTKTITRTYAK